MKLNAFKFKKHNTAFKTSIDWREGATDWDLLPVHEDREEGREEIPMQVALRTGDKGQQGRDVLSQVQENIRIRDRKQPRLPDDHARRTK